MKLEIVKTSCYDSNMHEYRGSFNPARLYMDDFFNWIDSNNLFHIPYQRGAIYMDKWKERLKAY
jgi:hypothetical protein